MHKWCAFPAIVLPQLETDWKKKQQDLLLPWVPAVIIYMGPGWKGLSRAKSGR